jgi:hypothetical protein
MTSSPARVWREVLPPPRGSVAISPAAIGPAIQRPAWSNAARSIPTLWRSGATDAVPDRNIFRPCPAYRLAFKAAKMDIHMKMLASVGNAASRSKIIRWLNRLSSINASMIASFIR